MNVNPAFSTNLYVDYENGSDENLGTSKTSAWKHAPGDRNSKSRANNYDLKASDTIIFKGGVEYFGSIIVPSPGEKSNPITYKGDGWGESKAILNGSKNVETRFMKCLSTLDCYNNPNWKNLYKSKIGPNIDPLVPIFIDGKRLWLASEPNQPDPFWFDDIQNYSVIEKSNPDSELTSTYLNPDIPLDQNPASWGGGLIAIWMKPNVILIQKIRDIDYQSGKIFFSPVKNEPYADRDSYYSFLNRPKDLDVPGEFIFDEKLGILMFWPHENGSVKSNKLFYNNLPFGFNINGMSNIRIEGFNIKRYFGGEGDWNYGSGIMNLKKNAANLEIRNNEISELKSVTGVGSIILHHVTNALVENNIISDNQKNFGVIIAHSTDVIIKRNIIRRIGRSGMFLLDNNNVQVIENKLTEIKGNHGNGISIYLKNKDILVASNIITKTPSAFTFHGTGNPLEADNLLLFNNVFLGRVNSWGRKYSSVKIFNNLFFAPNERGKALQIPASEDSVIIENNIIDGLVVKTTPANWRLMNNAYTSLSWTQSSKYGWYLEESSVISNLSATSFKELRDSDELKDLPEGASITDQINEDAFSEFDFSPWKINRPMIGPNFGLLP